MAEKNEMLNAEILLPAWLPSPQLFRWAPGSANLSRLEVNVRPDVKLPIEEGYELVMTPQGTAVNATTPRAAQWGQATVAQLQAQTAGGGLVPAATVRDWPTLAIRALHLDMKYLAPRFDWMLAWLDQLAAWKCNTIYLEYEDKFPYRLPEVACRTAWTKEQIRQYVGARGRIGD